MTRVRRAGAAPATHSSARVRGRRRAEPVTITGAAPSLQEDLSGRMRRYWLLMGVRIACLASLVVVPRQWWWVSIGLALAAPLLAVLVANSGREGGGPSAGRTGRELVTLQPDDDAASPSADARRAPTYHVRPGEFLR
ncbi:DUF3099 domain-containing protein [Georgenia sp. Z1344]|uniref:DUF3099 domain-containing protein n=1 Tax=Georgenia sp. Z1344 TaxID=3416706 RepID=UPI003CEB7168